MSKTFKSVLGYPLTIDPSDGQNIGIGTIDSYLAIADKDVPSLMLALGEAAGIVPKWDGDGTAGTPEHLAHSQWHLQRYIAAQAAIAAQAKEAAKLEAEALELCNDYRTAMGYPTVESFEGFSAERVNGWIAVARKAREIGN